MAIVDRASFARAADDLGLSPVRSSQTIRQLESRLVRLLIGKRTASPPTEPGRRLHERVAQMLRDMDEAKAANSSAP